MLRYSWNKIYRVAGHSSQRVYLCLASMLRTPRNKWDPLYRYSLKDFSGESYLLNPYGLLRSGVTYKEIAEYVALASYRNYAEYATTNDASLDLFHSPLPVEKLQPNRLLSIEDGRIRFVYEEVTKTSEKK